MTVSDMNIASLLDVFDYALVLIYGLALDVFISGGCDTPPPEASDRVPVPLLSGGPAPGLADAGRAGCQADLPP
ncbi:MAG: hypothetical protein ACLS3F_02950 [Oscillospiraceae bacterium]